MMKNLIVRRIYDDFSENNYHRILVDRFWPRGISKKDVCIDRWEKEIAPPRELVVWFHQDKEKRFEEFEKKYTTYLEDHANLVADITRREGGVALITAVKDIEHSHIPSLLRYIKNMHNLY